ncbi:MAG: phosphatase PAP2 family protein, partial [Planctomycetaceae bacterium]|nr:phosphatase PAP2 family protein [Planctomycetaceae bacterium]
MILIAFFTAVFRWTDADIFISSLFYDHARNQWVWFFNSGCTLFYRGGIYPAVVLCICGGLLLPIGHITRNWTLYRAGWFLLLLFAIGPGLIVNYGFKTHWGRPRPHQIMDFDGLHAFVSVGSPGTLEHHNSSFPSGHAAVAFYLIAPAFLASPQRRGMPTKLMIAGLSYGGVMALVRVVQGGHFVSDVVWSAAIVYFTAVI